MSKYYEECENLNNHGLEAERKISKVTIRGTKTIDIPMWVINYFTKCICDNYSKLVYIFNIIELFSNEKPDIADIGISTESVPIGQDGKDFESKLIDCVKNSNRNKKKEKYCLMSYKPESKEKDFWHYFSSCERPICFVVTKDNNIIFLYNPRGKEGIKLCDISYHSPITISLSGISECVDCLINAHAKVRNDKRLQDEHEAKMVTQAMQTMDAAINVQNKLQNSNLPEGHKIYLQNMYDAIMAKQEKINETIGILPLDVDVKI